MYYKIENILFLAALVSFVSIADAASISWQPAFELVSDSDIDLNYGPIVYAVNGGDNTGNESFMTSPQPSIRTVSVGSTNINFEGIEAIYGNDASFGQIGFPFETFGDAVDHLPGDGSNVTFSTSNTRTVAVPQVSFDLDASDGTLGSRNYNVGTGNSDLDVILASQVFFDGRGIGASALNISLNNLNLGQSYQIQLFGPAAESGRISESVVDDGVGNSVTGFGGLLDLDNDSVAHVTSVIGTFTADSSSQPINVVLAVERNSGISGLVLTTAVPEPSAIALVAIALCGTLYNRR